MEGNEILKTQMVEKGLTQAELADAVNDRLLDVGYHGTVSDRTVRNWITGKTRWPHPRQRSALEAVFGYTAVELGFTPPADTTEPTTPPEQPVRRRNFLTATTGTTASVLPLVTGRPPSVGTSDVLRLRSGLDALMALDDQRGGHESLEHAALAGAKRALDLQQQAASQRVRQRLFSVAADYTATAAWSAIDACQAQRAQQYLERALYLSRMARDPVVELRVWNSDAMLAHQRQNHTQAVHSAQAAQATAITRRDPLFASLAHARTAIAHSNLGERQAALRYLGLSAEALEKADAEAPRPSWIAFYGPAELTAISAIVRDRIGDPAEAEAASHEALASIPPQFRRNRALATGRLALAQLHQHDIEQACATTEHIFDLIVGNPIPGRLRSLLGDFYRDLITLAPHSNIAQEWGDRFRGEWSRT